MYYSCSAPKSFHSSNRFDNLSNQQSNFQCDAANMRESSERRDSTSNVGWHVILARLLVQLRSAIPENECNIFDAAHSRALKREVPLVEFFSYCLSRLRTYAPHLEPQFREVFRLRNESRRRKRSASINRSISAPSGLNSMADDLGDGEDLELNMSRLCVKTDIGRNSNNCFESTQAMSNTLSLGKRNSEDLGNDMIRRITAKSLQASYSSTHANRVM